MKVLHVAETIKGGVGTIINSLIKIESVENYVIAPDDQGNIINGKVFKFKRSGRNLLSLARLSIKCYQIMREIKPDIIHLHSTFAGLMVRILYILRLLNKRDTIVIYTPHAFSFLRGDSALKKNAYAFIERMLSIVTDKIVCTSKYELEQGLLYGLDENKLGVIYNGVNLSSAPPLIISERDEKIKILFLGRLDYQKGYDYLVKLIDLINGSKFHIDIVGDAVNDNITKIKKDNVVYHGWVDFENIKKFFTNSDFLIMPSRWESFGLVAVEAQSFGLPVVANNCSSLPEVIENERTGVLLDFSDLNSVADYINSKDRMFWESKKEKCRPFVEARFDERKMIIEYLSLYKKFLGD
ncbi:TPA: glycosyltransferase [Raoultella ornithinolytica]